LYFPTNKFVFISLVSSNQLNNLLVIDQAGFCSNLYCKDTKMEELLKGLPDNATMRDIFDFCKKNNIHSLAQGMIELPPPIKLRERAANICLSGSEIHQYRNRFGEDEYRDALVQLLEKRYNTKVPKEAILATSGVSGALVATLMMLKNEKGGTEKVKGPGILVPFYTYHVKQINDLLGKDPVYVNTNDDFSPNWTEIEKALAGGLDLLMFTNPGNPQGNLWSKEDILKLVELTSKSNTLLMIDEIYSDLVWKGKFYSPIETELFKHVIVCRGFSKSLACQSWRCGYIVAHPSLTERIMRIHDPIYISVPWQQHAIGQYLLYDFDDFDRHIQETSKLMQNNWKLLSKAIEKHIGWTPIEPSGSMYGLFYHHANSDKEAIVKGLAHGIGVAPGKIFWPHTPENTGYVRIHCGISEEKAHQIVEALEKKPQN